MFQNKYFVAEKKLLQEQKVEFHYFYITFDSILFLWGVLQKIDCYKKKVNSLFWDEIIVVIMFHCASVLIDTQCSVHAEELKGKKKIIIIASLDTTRFNFRVLSLLARHTKHHHHLLCAGPLNWNQIAKSDAFAEYLLLAMPDNDNCEESAVCTQDLNSS